MSRNLPKRNRQKYPNSEVDQIYVQVQPMLVLSPGKHNNRRFGLQFFDEIIRATILGASVLDTNGVGLS